MNECQNGHFVTDGVHWLWQDDMPTPQECSAPEGGRDLRGEVERQRRADMRAVKRAGWPGPGPVELREMRRCREVGA